MDSIRPVKPAEEMDLGHGPAVVIQRPGEQIVFPGAIDLEKRQRARPIHSQEIDEPASSGTQVCVECEEATLDDSRIRQDRLLDGLKIAGRSLRGVDSQPLPVQATVRNARRQYATRPRCGL